jgi:hypothetical protein
MYERQEDFNVIYKIPTNILCSILGSTMMEGYCFKISVSVPNSHYIRKDDDSSLMFTRKLH